MHAGTVAGRKGLFLDCNNLAPMLARRLGATCFEGGDSCSGPGAHSRFGAAVSLHPGQKNLILKILGRKGECTEDEVGKFKRMHPGIRTLRFRNYISSLWTEGGWHQELGRLVASGKRLASGFERADLICDEMAAAWRKYEGLIFDLGLGAPSLAEMEEALMAPGELSQSQSAFFRKAAREDGPLKNELDDFRLWAESLGPYELRHAWRSAKPNVLTVASLANKLRFCRGPITDDESVAFRIISGRDDAGQKDMEKLEYAFSGDISLFGDLLPGIVALIGNPAEPILEAARTCSEFETLLDFMHVPRETVVARLSPSPGFSKPHSQLVPDHPDNDDALTSISLIIRNECGSRTVSLDIAFDGVSGHGGASVASRIAKDAFEVASLAGWIRSPEDVRLVTQLADLAIDIEKERRGIHNMGTTLAASYIEGNRFYAIHCGDSDCLVVRNGNVVFRTEPHGRGNVIWSGLGIGTRAIQINNLDSNPQHFGLESGDAILTLTDGIGDVMCDHEYGILSSKHANDADGLQAAIVAAADSRKDPYSSYPLACGCEGIGGKDDDMTLIARFIRLPKT